MLLVTCMPKKSSQLIATLVNTPFRYITLESVCLPLHAYFSALEMISFAENEIRVHTDKF